MSHSEKPIKIPACYHSEERLNTDRFCLYTRHTAKLAVKSLSGEAKLTKKVIKGGKSDIYTGHRQQGESTLKLRGFTAPQHQFLMFSHDIGGESVEKESG